MLYLTLFHGRKTPDEKLDDWGFEGPIIGPFDSVHWTYGFLRLYREIDMMDVDVNIVDNLVVWRGDPYNPNMDGFYGDFHIESDILVNSPSLRGLEIAYEVWEELR